MKNIRINMTGVLLTLCLLLGGMASLQAQQDNRRTISGKVVDEAGEPLTGVSIMVVGTTIGTVTDVDGNYSLQVPSSGGLLKFSFIGFESQQVAIPSENKLNVELRSDTQELGDVVVVGYGTQRKSDLTGSVTSVGSDDFNVGLISSPEQLINGKVSGVQIMSNSGSPNSGNTIRVRGGASLNASNDPLIVLDGLPLEAGGISGNSGNFLSLINPNDIENMTILKDASSAAIYGSRASNGVILITTKKGSGKGLQMNFGSTNSIQTITRLPDMLSRDEFIDVINSRGTAEQKAILGSADTDWNKEVYNPAFGTDNNLSISNLLMPHMPGRLSVGYYSQDGILRTDHAERYTGSISLSPSLLNDFLKFTLNAKGSHNNNTFANTNAIWAASAFNPTLEVYSGNSAFGGFNEVIDNSGNPVNAAVRNPLGLLMQNSSTSKVDRLVGNVDMDYKLYFLPELKWHTTVGYDYATGEGTSYVPAEATEYYTTFGRDFTYGPQKNINRLLTTYLNYNKLISSIKSNVEATLGYDFQYWKSTRPIYSELNTRGEIQSTFAATDQRHTLRSYYARLNYSYDNRYLLTTTFRQDASSRFHQSFRDGFFPSIGLAWKISEESFLKGNPVLSTLKLKVSYGETGQQEGIGNYSYLPVYTLSQEGAQVQFGNQWYNTYRPEPYVGDITWETTSSWNAGLDFGILEDRVTGSIDVYSRLTKDLLARVPAPAGTNFAKTILTNVGNVDSKGIELTLNATPIKTEIISWDLRFNMSWQTMKVKNLSLVKGGVVTNTLAGPSIDSYQFQVLSEGYEPYMFYLYHQLYDAETGKPIEGAYADLNKDGNINSSDLYRYHSPAPDYILGLSSSLNYKKWTMAMTLRANVGNYVYNGMAMNTGAWSTVSYNSYQLNNLNSSFLTTGFRNRQYLSDYYIENASFLKMDNLSVGYNFGEIGDWFSLNINGMVQNVFTLTNYTGVDPEVPNGMDISFYPRPRTYSIGLGLHF